MDKRTKAQIKRDAVREAQERVQATIAANLAALRVARAA